MAGNRAREPLLSVLFSSELNGKECLSVLDSLSKQSFFDFEILIKVTSELKEQCRLLPEFFLRKIKFFKKSPTLDQARGVYVLFIENKVIYPDNYFFEMLFKAKLFDLDIIFSDEKCLKLIHSIPLDRAYFSCEDFLLYPFDLRMGKENCLYKKSILNVHEKIFKNNFLFFKLLLCAKKISFHKINCEIKAVEPSISPVEIKSFLGYINDKVTKEYEKYLYRKKILDLLFHSPIKVIKEPSFSILKNELEVKKNNTIIKLIGARKNTKIIPIFIHAWSTQEIYIMMPLIESIKKYAKISLFYDIFILLNKELVENFQEKIEGLSEDNVRLTCIEITNSSLPSTLFSAMWRNVSFLTNYKKSLYLVPETLVKTDLERLFSMNLNNHFFAIPMNTSNLSVLLLNLEDIRKGIAENMFTDDTKSKYIGKFFPLSDKYAYPSSRFFTDFSSDILNEPEIIFFDKEKPYLNPLSPFATDWWRFARCSPFYKEILEKFTPTSNPNIVSPIKSPFPLRKVSLLEMENEAIFNLAKRYINCAFHYFFSRGAKKQKYLKELRLVAQLISKKED